jgi:hypothetical protein
MIGVSDTRTVEESRQDRLQQEGGMHLRHIRPRSVDWYDATLEEGAKRQEPLSPEEKSRLRQLGEAEGQVSLRAIDEAAVRHHGSGRALL